jgi:hypothetical protein
MNASELTNEELRALFLSWFNDFLSVDTFAEYYGLTDDFQALRVIEQGRELHEKYVEEITI